MTQSLLNNGKEKNLGDKLNANPKWVCGEDFKPRPLNQSGVPRVEMARERECPEGGEHFLVIYDPSNKTFTNICSRCHRNKNS